MLKNSEWRNRQQDGNNESLVGQKSLAFIRTIGIARAEAAITLANMAYNMKRWCWLDGRIAPA